MVVIIIILGILCLALLYSTYNLLRKNEQMEEGFGKLDNEVMDYVQFITKLELDLKKSFEQMKRIDSKGGFESDDEVGQVFKSLKNIIKQLDEKYGNEEA